MAIGSAPLREAARWSTDLRLSAQQERSRPNRPRRRCSRIFEETARWSVQRRCERGRIDRVFDLHVFVERTVFSRGVDPLLGALEIDRPVDPVRIVEVLYDAGDLASSAFKSSGEYLASNRRLVFRRGTVRPMGAIAKRRCESLRDVGVRLEPSRRRKERRRRRAERKLSRRIRDRTNPYSCTACWVKDRSRRSRQRSRVSAPPRRRFAARSERISPSRDRPPFFSSQSDVSSEVQRRRRYADRLAAQIGGRLDAAGGIDEQRVIAARRRGIPVVVTGYQPAA